MLAGVLAEHEERSHARPSRHARRGEGDEEGGQEDTGQGQQGPVLLFRPESGQAAAQPRGGRGARCGRLPVSRRSPRRPLCRRSSCTSRVILPATSAITSGVIGVLPFTTPKPVIRKCRKDSSALLEDLLPARDGTAVDDEVLVRRPAPRPESPAWLGRLRPGRSSCRPRPSSQLSGRPGRPGALCSPPPSRPRPAGLHRLPLQLQPQSAISLAPLQDLGDLLRGEAPSPRSSPPRRRASAGGHHHPLSPVYPHLCPRPSPPRPEDPAGPQPSRAFFSRALHLGHPGPKEWAPSSCSSLQTNLSFAFGNIAK